jgi:hypothetical protein
VYSNGTKSIASPGGSEWSAIEGDHSLLVSYPAGESWAEQRFDLGTAYKELWLQYWVKVPPNYFHGQSFPSNHKFLALWMDAYSQKGEGATVLWEFWGSDDGSSRLAVHYNEGAAGTSTGHLQRTAFVSPDDQGRWMEITVHLKASSDNATHDGIIELWRRWENEPASNREKLHSVTDALLSSPTSGPKGWQSGYFMGWANSPYAQDTEWLIDHITISENSLLDTKGLTSEAINAPNPPVLSLEN